MLIKKISTGTMTAAVVVVMASWASLATAAVTPADVAAALDPNKSLAQQTAEIRVLAETNPNNPDLAQLGQLVAARISQDQAASFAGALGAACATASDKAQATRTLVDILAGRFTSAGGTIVGQLISVGCLAEVAANQLQITFLTAAGQFEAQRQRQRNIEQQGPGTGVSVNYKDVKSRNLTRLGNLRGALLTQTQEGALSPTTLKDKGPELPEYTGDQ